MENKKRTVYVNGQYLPETEAKISIFDRGFLMADAVYEVIAVIDGKLIDDEPHLRRLARSLGELNIPYPQEDFIAIAKKLLKENNLKEGTIYLQISRGTAERNFTFSPELTPNIIMFTQTKSIVDDPLAKKGLRVMTQHDIRWQRRDIKTTQLLAQSLGKMIAIDAGFDDVWFVDDFGYVTEGSSNNTAIIVGDKLITRQANHEILDGITRHSLFKALERFDLTLVEQKFTPQQAQKADAALMTASSSLVMPVVNIDEHHIGDGKPASLVLDLRQAYIEIVTDMLK